VISSVDIENWRSVESLSVPLESLTAFVGPNGAGKTAVLDAIDFVLGARWPAMAYLGIPRDFRNLDTTQELRIRCNFSPTLTYTDAMNTDHEVGCLEFHCRPYKRKTGSSEAGDLHDDYVPLSPSGEQITVCTTRPSKGSRPQFGPLLRISGGLRDQARVLTIGDRRTVASQASGRRGSVLNTLLSRVRKDFDKDAGGTRSSFKDQYELALETLRTEAVQTIEATIADTTKRMLGFLGSGAVKNLDLSFGFADPANPFGSLTMFCKEDNVVLPAEVMGLGIQSAIVVGVFDALRQQQANVGTLLLEEPEMYLHPQAQRFFHRILVEMADAEQCQVLFSTHSPIFADMTRFASVRLFQKPAAGTTHVDWVREDKDRAFLADQLKRQKLTQYMDAASSEALFARRVLLVEGHGDYLAAQTVARRRALDLDAEGLSIIPCGGKNAIPFFGRMCRALGIPTVVLHDEDLYSGAPETLEKWQRDENARAPAQNKAIADAVGDDDHIFKISPCLEAVLGIGRNASDKPLKVVEAIEACKDAELPSELVAAVKALANGS
jgi:putative ATP-dependent endonuclease of OLD family